MRARSHRPRGSNVRQRRMLRRSCEITRDALPKNRLRLSRPPILVPTPGQTEQEYLARQLALHGSAIHLDQNKLTAFTLKQAMLAPGVFPARTTDNSMLRKAIENLINLH